MNYAQLHMMLIHFPIVGFIAAFGLLVYALARGSSEARNIALVGVVLSGLAVLPVLVTGNAAENYVEHLPGVREALIQQHENAADLAGTLAVVAGAVALLTLIVQRWAPRFSRAGMAVTLATVLIAAVGIGWTAHLGGEIRHPELAVAWNAPAGQPGGENGEGAERSLRGGGLGGTSLLPGLGAHREHAKSGEHDRD
jgi:Predicted membrane protein (DUF2231)